MSYQSFLIAPFGTGLDTDLSPWLLPQDAFSSIVNGHIHHGVLQKRSGYSKQGDLVHQDQTNWKITGVSLADPCVVSVTSTAGLAIGNTVEIRNVVGTTQLNGNQYTISSSNFTGTSFELDNVDSSNFTAWSSVGDVYLIPGNRVMGIERYIDTDNAKEVIAFGTNRACKYNSTNGVYDPLDSVDIFDVSSGETDYIWADNWASTGSSIAVTNYRLYFTNGLAYASGPPEVNGIRYYDGGTTTTLFRPQINGGAGRFINGCKLLSAFRQRLVLLHTIEGSTTYPQRARWCQAQGPSISDGWDDNVAGKGGFVDAPTGDHIISSRFVQDILIVFFTNSVWTLRPTADPALPFRWDRINDFRSCDAKMSSAQFDRYVVAAGIRGLTATDGIETRRFDERIEDFVDNVINDSEFAKVFARRDFGDRRLWMLYPGVGSTDSNNALIYDEESSAFSTYAIDMNVLGYGGSEKDATIADFGERTIDTFDETIQDFFFDEGSEIFLGGNTSGEIFVLGEGDSDNLQNPLASILGATAANPVVITMSDDVGLSNGDSVFISDVVGMVEINDANFIVASKSGNTFALKGIDGTAYTSYTSGGTVGWVVGSPYTLTIESAAWNPWMSEGRQSQFGYIDLFIDTHDTATIDISFFVDNDNSPYATKSINMLPNVTERGSVSNISNANPANVIAASHGLTTSDEVYLYTVEGMADANGGPYVVTVVDENNFTIGIDSTCFGAYANGGVITELPSSSTKAWKRIYAGGTGYQHKIRITAEGENKPVSIHAFMPWFKPRSVRPI